MKKYTSWILIAAATAMLLQGCTQSSQPNAQQPAQQNTAPNAVPNTAPNTAQNPAQPNQQPATPPSSSGQAAPQPAAPQISVDLSRELKVNPLMTVGITTYDDLVKRFGKAESEEENTTAFRTGFSDPSKKFPQIKDLSALFHINPVTGEKMDQVFPYSFTNDDKKVLVSSQIVLKRGDLLLKEKDHTITLDDVKKVYGAPLRESPAILEYYDFDHKIALHITLQGKGNISSRLTKYDLLYGENKQDQQMHEEEILKLAAKAKKQ